MSVSNIQSLQSYEVVSPDSENLDGEPPARVKEMAKEFPFTLDPFQEIAIRCLEAGDSVFVAAHTSAGKTVVAQYACTMAIRDKTRLIYTSPIKALSNQKYREFFDDFKDVGLITGDTSINPKATILVMTAEIFRSMLYSNYDTIKEVRMIIFDEIHYLRDKERGVVWEECLSRLPSGCRAAFLSATVPNAGDFASWFSGIHRSRVHIVKTEHRPVPLQHYIYPTSSDGLHLVIDENSYFRDDNFQVACSEAVGEPVARQLQKKGKVAGVDQESDIYKLIRMLLQRNYDPIIIFSFGKRQCETLALQVSKFDINSDDEKQIIEKIFTSAIDTLSEKDQALPQIKGMFPLLQQGIAIHHSGVMPIIKELIEILFQEGLIKVLFATETFSMGLNMPAKTVIFSGIKKFDNGKFRNIFSGEYIQMSGRAGRRGLDQRGIVILMMDRLMDPVEVKDILRGGALPLISQFRLTYSMILNILRLENGNPEEFIRRSFGQFMSQRSIPKLEDELNSVIQSIAQLEIDREKQLRNFYDKKIQLFKIENKFQSNLAKHKYYIKFLQVGRLVQLGIKSDSGGEKSYNVKDLIEDNCNTVWGCIVNFQLTTNVNANTKEESTKPQYNVDIIVNCNFSENAKGISLLPLNSVKGMVEVIGIPLECIYRISAIRINIPSNLKKESNRLMAKTCMHETIKKLNITKGELPMLDLKQDLRIKEKDILKLENKIKKLRDEIKSNEIIKDPEFEKLLEKFLEKQRLVDEQSELSYRIKAARGLLFKNELRHMIRLLRSLNFINDTGVLQVKGLFAHNIRTADCILLTEMVFHGDFGDLSPNEVAALCSTFVYSDAHKPKKLSSEIHKLHDIVQKSSKRVAKAMLECKTITNITHYINLFNPDLMEVVLAWSKGAEFQDIQKLSDFLEGSVIRWIRQLNEVLSELHSSISAVGDRALAEKIKNAQESIHRGIIFAASLYL